MDSSSFTSVSNETYPLARAPQSAPSKKTLLADIALLVGDMQASTQRYLARENAMREWTRIHVARAPEHITGVVLSDRA